MTLPRGLLGILISFCVGVASSQMLTRAVASFLPNDQFAWWTVATADHSRKAQPEARKDKRLVTIDPGIASALGIEVVEAGPGIIKTGVRVVGTIGFNEDKLARIVPRAPGVVREIAKSLGDRVTAGETIAVLDSKEVAEARAKYLAASIKLDLSQSTMVREDKLFQMKIGTIKPRTQAESELAQALSDMRVATQTLFTLGFSDTDLQRLQSAPSDFTRYEIVAPFSGEIVERRVFVGEQLSQDREIFLLSDLDVLWVNLQVGPQQIKEISVGKVVKVTTSEKVMAEATISYIAPVVSEELRAVRVRAELVNKNRGWRPGTAVEAILSEPNVTAAMTVPSTAVQRIDGHPVVFLSVNSGFRMQPIKVGRSDGKIVEVLKGIKLGDKLANGSTLVLKAELEKGGLDDDD